MWLTVGLVTVRYLAVGDLELESKSSPTAFFNINLACSACVPVVITASEIVCHT